MCSAFIPVTAWKVAKPVSLEKLLSIYSAFDSRNRDTFPCRCNLIVTGSCMAHCETDQGTAYTVAWTARAVGLSHPVCEE